MSVQDRCCCCGIVQERLHDDTTVPPKVRPVPVQAVMRVDFLCRKSWHCLALLDRPAQPARHNLLTFSAAMLPFSMMSRVADSMHPPAAPFLTRIRSWRRLAAPAHPSTALVILLACRLLRAQAHPAGRTTAQWTTALPHQSSQRCPRSKQQLHRQW